MKTRFTLGMSAAALLAALLSACAATGPNSPSARPVLYPNATLTRVGEAQGRAQVDACMAQAETAGLTPDEKNNAVGRGAAQGAVTAGVMGAVGALVSGGGIEGMVRSGAGGAAIGGAVGGAANSMNERASATFRTYVHRCLSDKGFEVIGWN